MPVLVECDYNNATALASSEIKVPWRFFYLQINVKTAKIKMHLLAKPLEENREAAFKRLIVNGLIS